MNQLITKNEKNLVLAGITISKYWYSDCTNSKSWKKNSLTGIYECVRNCLEKVDTSQPWGFFTFPFSLLVHIFLGKNINNIMIIYWSLSDGVEKQKSLLNIRCIITQIGAILYFSCFIFSMRTLYPSQFQLWRQFVYVTFEYFFFVLLLSLPIVALQIISTQPNLNCTRKSQRLLIRNLSLHY